MIKRLCNVKIGPPVWTGWSCFGGLLQSEPLASLRAALAADAAGLTGAVAAFESALFTQGTNWTEVLLDAVLEDENLCLRTAAGGDAGRCWKRHWKTNWNFCSSLALLGWMTFAPKPWSFCRGGR